MWVLRIVLKQDVHALFFCIGCKSFIGTSLTGKEIIIQRGKGIVIVPGSKENKVRFVGPSIKDLGFETDKNIEKEKAPEESESKDEGATLEPESETDSEDEKSNDDSAKKAEPKTIRKGKAK